ncbi:MAG: hypothetical protein ACD_51C00333G0011 [uncultured bacterium]|nr:MAG: hypothetical protein ACD_51C00333G0011 [uncultured bacterium]
MPQYKYVAITQDNQKMTGSLSAQNEDEARKELNKLNLAILSITEATETPAATTTPPPQATPKEDEKPRKVEEVPITTAPPVQQEQKTGGFFKKTDNKILTKFEFEARDKTGKKIVGTIPGIDKLSAFKRLVTEYQFDVSYISKLDNTPEEKTKDREEGTTQLKAQIEDLQKAESEINAEASKDKDFKEQQKILLDKVDYVLEKIKAVLSKYDQEIRPENKKLIQGYIDKLLRIKNSTNLEYIEHTAEELLSKIQSQELFLHKEMLQKEKASLIVETQEMMASLHSTDTHKKTFIEDLHGKLPMMRFKPLEKILLIISEKFKQDPEILSLKSIIGTTNKQLITYIKIWIKTSDKDARKQVSESIKSILEERKNLKEKLRTLKHQKKTKVITQETTIKRDTLTEETANFLGWLLGFYLLYYFATYYLTQKKLDYTISLPWNPDMTENGLLKYLVSIIFLWYILLAGKTKFLPRQKLITPFIGLAGIIATALLIFNF